MKFTRRDLLRKTTETGLILGSVAVGGMSLYRFTRDYPNAGVLISASQLKPLVSREAEVRIVDVRGPEDYKNGHIPNAVNIWDREMNTWSRGIPRMRRGKGEMENLMGSAGVDNSTAVVIYGQEDNLWPSRLFWVLKYYGHSRVKILQGGIRDWKGQGEELAQKEPSFSSRKFSARPDPEKLATGKWLRDQLDDPRIKIIDCRSRAGYQGRESRARRSGHVPGALSIPSQEILVPDGRFRPYNDLKLIYQKAGLNKEDTVVTYSHTGVRAAQGYLGLRLMGFPNVRVYDGSWAEWGNLEGFSIEGSQKEKEQEEEGSLCW